MANYFRILWCVLQMEKWSQVLSAGLRSGLSLGTQATQRDIYLLTRLKLLYYT